MGQAATLEFRDKYIKSQPRSTSLQQKPLEPVTGRNTDILLEAKWLD